MKLILSITLFFIFSTSSIASNLTAYSSIAPLSYVVEAIAGDKLIVKTVLPDGKAPASFNPSMKKFEDIKRANILFVLDVFFEKNLIGKLKKEKNLKLVNVGEGIKRRRMTEGHHHHDAEEFDLDADFKDPHFWLAPENVEYMAKNVYRFMVKIDEKNREYYRKNHDDLLFRVRETNAKVKELFKDLTRKEVYVFHPSFGYFLDAYNLKQVSIEFEGKTPTAKKLYQIIEQAKKDKVTHLFGQPQFAKRPVKIVAHKIKAKVRELNPLVKDILANWEVMATEIQKALK